MLLQDERIDTNQLDSDIALMFASKKDHKEIAEMLIIKYKKIYFSFDDLLVKMCDW